MIKKNCIAVGILGAGYISEFHLRALRQIVNLEVVAICDMRENIAKQFSLTHGIRSYYSDLNLMLKNEQLDVVHVLTPANLHYEVSKQIIEAGVDVFIEKPLCHLSRLCGELINQAQKLNRQIGVSHNFLFYPSYQKLFDNVLTGELGKLDQVEIVWNKSLGELKGKSLNAWMFKDTSNILFEIAIHSFAHLLHLIGEPEELELVVAESVKLENSIEFYKRFELLGKKGDTKVRVVFSFNDAYPEHYIKVRGTNAVASAELINDVYTCYQHQPYLLDVDNYLNVLLNSVRSILQSSLTFLNFILAKLKLSKRESSFAYSIYLAINSFYSARSSAALDKRISPEFGELAVTLAEKISNQIVRPVCDSKKEDVISVKPTIKTPSVLVLGGTGFIGKSLVRRLLRNGYGVRVLARSACLELEQVGAEVFLGDYTNSNDLARSLAGIEIVYHLARSASKTWKECLQTEIEPTRMIAQLCLERAIKRVFYASSIVIYNAGRKGIVINENTEADLDLCHAVLYPRSKIESERLLLKMYHEQNLPVVIFRPGVVLGEGGSPFHWGVAAWPYNTICSLYGDGNNLLPIILVEDLVDAMVRAIEVQKIEGESFNLVGPPLLTANDYLDELEAQLGRKIKRIKTPAWKPYLSSLIKWSIKRLGGNRDITFPTYSDYYGRSFASTFDYSKSQNILSWKPTIDKVDLLREINKSFRSWLK